MLLSVQGRVERHALAAIDACPALFAPAEAAIAPATSVAVAQAKRLLWGFAEWAGAPFVAAAARQGEPAGARGRVRLAPTDRVILLHRPALPVWDFPVALDMAVHKLKRLEVIARPAARLIAQPRALFGRLLVVQLRHRPKHIGGAVGSPYPVEYRVGGTAVGELRRTVGPWRTIVRERALERRRQARTKAVAAVFIAVAGTERVEVGGAAVRGTIA